MKRRNVLCIALGIVGLLGSAAFALPSRAGPLRVVATLPDLADIVKAIGGDRVEVSAIARGKENTHAVPVKPSHLVAMSKADLFVQIGLSLESSYVPGLLENARNPAIRPGSPGFLNVSEGWTALDVPANLSRAQGDVHPHGNPHMNVDPRAGRHIADAVLAALERIDPAGAEEYRSRRAEYGKLLDEAEKRWAEAANGWSGQKVVVYHGEFDYLAAAYGFSIAGRIEPKPGIPPTPNHVAQLIDQMKSEGVHVILTAIWSNNATVARIAEATGAVVVELPNMCGGLPGTETWIGMMDAIHERLAGAFSSGEAKAR